MDDSLPTSVRGDSARLGQVITNLVSNAVKFTKEGMIRIDAVVLKETNTQVKVRISIEDEGIGIAPEKQNAFLNPLLKLAPIPIGATEEQDWAWPSPESCYI
ncbi:MAG: hypothetical protein J4F31_11370 [Flavobacteriales bacterium]|nr:hypothetical protein [Flavobacteriales bacterium]